MTKPQLQGQSRLVQRRQGKNAEEIQIRRAVDPYVVSFETEPIRKKVTRHHWMICLVQDPDQLVSWGHAPTHALAETEARNEVENLSSGQTQGGHVTSKIMPFTHRMGVGN